MAQQVCARDSTEERELHDVAAPLGGVDPISFELLHGASGGGLFSTSLPTWMTAQAQGGGIDSTR